LLFGGWPLVVNLTISSFEVENQILFCGIREDGTELDPGVSVSSACEEMERPPHELYQAWDEGDDDRRGMQFSEIEVRLHQ